MEGRSTAGVLTASGEGKVPVNAAVRGPGAKWPRVDEPIGAAKKLGDAAAKRWRAEEMEIVALGTGKRQRVAVAALSGRKRKRDTLPEDDGTGVEDQSGCGGLQLVERRLSAMPVSLALPPLQELLNACRAAFNGSSTLPAATVVSSIRGIMDKIGPDNVGLTEEVRFFDDMNTADLQNPPIVTSKTIYECSNFTIAVFFLPRGAVMPLHGRPGMTVFRKLLIGSAHVEAYEWVRPRVFSGVGSWMLAEKVREHDVTAASGAWALFPDTAGGSMHRFVAAEGGPCAFLDVLTPPYSRTEQQRRRCAYYEEMHYELYPCVVSGGLTVAQRSRLAWLQEVAEPRDMRIANLPYRGPLNS